MTWLEFRLWWKLHRRTRVFFWTAIGFWSLLLTGETIQQDVMLVLALTASSAITLFTDYLVLVTEN